MKRRIVGTLRGLLLGAALYACTAGNTGGCGGSDDAKQEPQCTVPKDCETLTPPPTQCLGTWHCVEGSCDYQCVAAECTQDSDCAKGSTCLKGTCVATPECAADADCGAGKACKDGKCVAQPACTRDADCGDGKVCTSGICAPAPVCTEGAFGYACKATNPFGTCAGREVCQGGQWTCNARKPAAETCNEVDDDCNGVTDDGCTQPGCTRDAECPAGQRCLQPGDACCSGAYCGNLPPCGTCVAQASCVLDTDCAEWETCDHGTSTEAPGCCVPLDASGTGCPQDYPLCPGTCVLKAGRCWNQADCQGTEFCIGALTCPGGGTADPAEAVACLAQAGTCTAPDARYCAEASNCLEGEYCSFVIPSKPCCPWGAECGSMALPACECLPAAGRCWIDSDCQPGQACSGAWRCPPNADCSGPDVLGTCVDSDVKCVATKPGSHGSCEMVLGWIWDGSQCTLESGCSCAPDCAAIFQTQAACQQACLPTPTGCQSDADCPGGYCQVLCGNGWCKGVCQAGQKAPVPCTRDADCPTGSTCGSMVVCPDCVYATPPCPSPCQQQGVCLAPCKDSVECPQGFFCSTFDGTCQQALPD